MKDLYSILALCFLIGFWTPLVLAQSSGPKHEFRGAWVATVSNLDWPDSPNSTPAQQQASLIQLLDKLQASGLNAVMFQVRSEADAMYDSPLEPWSRFLTGRQGDAPAPYWDPLAFAIDEAHKRGMELHAWINPFRVQSGSRSYTASTHVTEQHPDWVLEVGTQKLLDPGIPAVRSYIIDVVADIVGRYDVDGIHYDDYFYPYPSSTSPAISTEDDDTFNQHNPQNFSSRGDWRRNNINQFVKGLYERVKAIKPWVKVGASPFGIWRSGTPSGIVGLSAYDVIYADAVNWMDQQWLDYLSPQLYWAFGGGQDYGALARWWESKRNDRHLYPGHWIRSNYTTDEVPRQINYNRSQAGIDGSVLFRAENLQSNTLGVAARLESDLYAFLALPPTMPWLDTTPPDAPTTPVASRGEGGALTVNWEAPFTWTESVPRYAVYRVQGATVPDPFWSMADPAALVAITSETQYIDRPPASPDPYYYFVTSVSYNSVESNPSAVLTVDGNAAVAVDEMATPQTFALEANYPNPFSTETTIRFSLPTAEYATLAVYDLLGREVIRLVDGMQSDGVHQVRWNGRTGEGRVVADGTYVYTLRTKQHRVHRVMVMVR
ncbi:MAG: family 10 glycosylhydrolase [Rhodothermales bacterium]